MKLFKQWRKPAGCLSVALIAAVCIGTASAANSSTSGRTISFPTGKPTCKGSSLGQNPCLLPAAPPSGKHVTIGFFTLSNNTFSAAMAQGATETAAKYNASVTVVLNPFSASTEASQIRDSLAAHKFDAYIVEPDDAGLLKPLFQQMVSAKIPFATVGINNSSNNSTTLNPMPGQTLQTSRPDNSYAADAAAAAKQACAKKHPCQVGFMRGTAALPFDTSASNIFLADAKKSGLDVVQTVFGDYSTTSAQTAMTNLLTVHPALNVIVTLGDQMSLGAEKAIDNAGKSKQVQIVSVGGGSTAVAAIKAHRWFASVVTLPINEGIMAGIATIAADRGVKLHLGIANIDTRGSLPSTLTQTNEAQWKNFKGQWSGL